jgi:hypothetical protein
MPHYGNVRHLGSRHVLKKGSRCPASPTIIFGKAPKIASASPREQSSAAGTSDP